MTIHIMDRYMHQRALVRFSYVCLECSSRSALVRLPSAPQARHAHVDQTNWKLTELSTNASSQDKGLCVSDANHSSDIPLYRKAQTGQSLRSAEFHQELHELLIALAPRA